MSRLDGLRYRLRTLFFARDATRELDDEIGFHLDLDSMHGEHEGAPPRQALEAAHRRLGNVTILREEIRMRSLRHHFDVFAQDLRFATRMLRHRPGFAFGATATLALGIGATTAIVSVLDAVVLRALPHADADRLVSVWSVNTTVDPDPFTSSPPDFRELATAGRTIDGIAAHYEIDVGMSSGGEPTRLEGARVSPSFFSLLSVTPLLGRTFTEEAGVHGQHRLAVISERLWRGRFGSDQGIVGRAVRIDREPHVVIGVVPDWVRLPSERVDVWLPMAFAPGDVSNTRGNYFLQIIAKVREGSTPADAESELGAIAQRIATTVPQSTIRSVRLRSLQTEIVGAARKPLLLLTGAIALVLLIACANVAGLLLARGATRGGEFALRASLGADRRRLMRQLMTEHLLLGLAGGLAGAGIAAAGIRLLVRFAPAGLSRIQDATLNARVLSGTLVIVLVTTVLFGLVPTLRLSRPDAGERLRGGNSTPGRSRGRAHGMLVGVQMALTLVLLAGAGLLLRSFSRVLEVDPGFATEHLLTMAVPTPEEIYRTPEQLWGFADVAVARLREIPGVRSAAVTSSLSLGGGSWGKRLTIASRPPDPTLDMVPTVAYRVVTQDYFATMGVRLLSGRTFDENDRRGGPGVAIVNESAVRKYWPGRNPIGETIWMGPPEEMVSSIIPEGFRFPRLQVVGVVADERATALDQPPGAEVYQLHEQVTETANGLYMVLRSERPATSLVAEVRAAFAEVDPEQPIADIATMQARVDRSTHARRFALVLLATFAATALVLAAVGLYSVIAFAVAERRRELAVRLALGASPESVLLLVVRRGMRPAAAGIAAGLIGVVLLSKALESMLFGVSRVDPATLVAVVLLLAGTALIACLIPARRGARTAPMQVLRAE